jgi:aromatic ring hydroxylase
MKEAGMTDVVQIALIGAIPATLAALASLAVGLSNRRNIQTNSGEIAQTNEKINAASEKIAEVGKQIDGRMDEHIALTKEISFAAGSLAGTKQEKKEEIARKVAHGKKSRTEIIR